MCGSSSPPKLETARLILDAHQTGDFEDLAALWADPDVVRHIGGQKSSREQSWARLLRYRGLWPLLGFGYWAVREKPTGRYIGDVGFADFHRPIEPSIIGIPEAGWVLASEAHGRGFGSEALAAVLAWLDRSTAHRRVVCLIADDNRASFRLAEKNGFHRAGGLTVGFENTSLLTRDG